MTNPRRMLAVPGLLFAWVAGAAEPSAACPTTRRDEFDVLRAAMREEGVETLFPMTDTLPEVRIGAGDEPSCHQAIEAMASLADQELFLPGVMKRVAWHPGGAFEHMFMAPSRVGFSADGCFAGLEYTIKRERHWYDPYDARVACFVRDGKGWRSVFRTPPLTEPPSPTE